MDLQLTGRTAVVLAASRGLGYATAHALASEGARVVLASRDAEAVREAAERIEAETGAETLGVAADITRSGDIEALIDAAVARFGAIDSLVTNAGGPPPGRFDDFTDADWQGAFELNLLSAVRTIRAALPHLRASDAPRAVFIASSSIHEPIDGLLLSNVFRAGLLGLAKSLAAELAGDGVLVNIVGPGRVDTERVRTLDAAQARKQGRDEAEIRAESAGRIPLGRYAEPAEFARTVTYLASPGNSYVTSQSMLVDGGMVRGL
ncbi:putative ketoacyl reductase [wastewater metagenome]|uniref:Putative ketoacyl reductase n=4 Tax=root TaxID=1 RepID=A0A5B8R688_9ZZZZ|nr:putative ketoacyl reductase [uncultured organism]